MRSLSGLWECCDGVKMARDEVIVNWARLRFEGQNRRPYPLHLRGGCGSHELERLRQSMGKA
jgi:hypothetical protein